MICKTCEILFEPTGRAQIFCSHDCRKGFTGDRREMKERAPRGEATVERTCEACNEQYTNHNRKYCSPGCTQDAVRNQKWNIPFKELRDFRLNNKPVCGVCCTTEKIVLDHCHETNKIRGWLCQQHNAAIGQLGDDMSGVMKAVEYLNNTI